MAFVTIQPPLRYQNVDIALPSSKSISNRLLMISAIHNQKISVAILSEAEDTVLMQKLLKQIESKISDTDTFLLNCQNAGTVFRFLTAHLSNKKGKWILDGSKRMRSRPIGILVEALRQMGGQIEYAEKEGFPPLIINGTPLIGGTISIDASVSSQYISALLMLASVIDSGLVIQFKNQTVSQPYINMTLQLLDYFGISSLVRPNQIIIKQQEIQPQSITVEPDWSSAAFWFSFVAISRHPGLFIKGLKLTSIQGDSQLPKIFSQLGVETKFLHNGIQLIAKKQKTPFFEYDFIACPDLAQAVAVCCAGLGIHARLSGLKNLRIKETDRLFALETELTKLGYNCKVDRNDDFIIGENKRKSNQNNLTINTYNDHRMAMAFACLSPLHPGIRIENPEVVSKSYPGFWEELKKVGFVLTKS